MPYVTLPSKAKNDAWGFQSANNHKNNLDYLKTQSEVLVAANATTPKDNVVPAATFKAANTPVEGASPVGRAALAGGQQWESIYQSPDFWAFQ